MLCGPEVWTGLPPLTPSSPGDTEVAGKQSLGVVLFRLPGLGLGKLQ